MKTEKILVTELKETWRMMKAESDIPKRRILHIRLSNLAGKLLKLGYTVDDLSEIVSEMKKEIRELAE